MKGFIIGFRIKIQPYLQHRCHLITGFICSSTPEDPVQFWHEMGPGRTHSTHCPQSQQQQLLQQLQLQQLQQLLQLQEQQKQH